MAKIIELKEDKLIKGGSKEPVYPITVAKAIYDKKNNNLLDIIDYTLPIEYNTRGVNNNLTLAVLAKVLKVDIPNLRIYLNTNLGKAYNPFIHNDVLIMDEYIGGKLVRHYKFTVDTSYFNLDDIYKEDGSINKSRVDWITWKLFIGDPNDIKEGDNLVFRDNLTDINRKGIVTINTIGNNAPNIEVLRGAETRPLNSLKVRIGNLQGINSPSFGELRDYGLYSTNAYLTGELQLTTGESTETRFKILDNLVSLAMSKTNYQINEENNILVNCSFSNDFEYWIKSQEEQDVYFMLTGDSEDDIIPVFMGDNILSLNFSTIEKVNIDGKEILRLNNASVELLNDIFKDRLPLDSIVTEYIKDDLGNIQYDIDGKTPLTLETLIRPKLYLSYRYKCRDGVPYTENGELVKDTDGNVIYKGKITIGFLNSHNITYTESMGDIVTLDELGLVSEIADINDGKWITRQFIAPYDGLGSFIIKVEGDVYIDFFAVTTKPLDNYKDVMSTEFRQTAETIGLYGHRINNIEGSITDLGIEIDNREEAIKLWALKELYNDSILTTALNSLFKITPGTITSLTEKILYNSEDILKKYTEVKQDYNGIKTSIYDITYDSEGLEILTIKFYNKTETASYVESILGSGFTPDNPVINSLNNLKNIIDTNKGNTDASINSLNSRISTSEGNIDILVKWKNDNLSNVALISTINNSLSTLTTNYNNTINANYPNSLAAQIATALGSINTLTSWKNDNASNIAAISTINLNLTNLTNSFNNQISENYEGSLAYRLKSAFGSIDTINAWKKDADGKIISLDSTVLQLPNNIKASVEKDFKGMGIDITHKTIYLGSTSSGLPSDVKSGKIVINTSNFTIDSSGNVTVNGSGIFTGAIYAGTGTFAGELKAATGSFSGSLNAATGTFSGDISAANGTFKGNINSSNVIATGGSFSGEIKASSGNIGGITIDSTGKIYTNYFSVEADGKLKCTEANISGTITAKSGKIGVVDISSTGALVTPYWSITADGKLWCAEAQIIGEITATSGTFDNCTINKTCKITKIQATTGTIGSWGINEKKLRTEADASLEVEVNGKRFLRINSPSDGKLLLAVRNDEGTAASFNAYGNGSIALALNGQAGDGSYALQSYGDVILNARAGEHINITGLTLSVKNISTTYTLTSNVDVVTFSNTTNITVTMPNARDNKGKVIFMKRVAGSGTITLSGLFYNPGNYGTTNTPNWVNDTKSMIFVSDGVGWIGFYCG